MHELIPYLEKIKSLFSECIKHHFVAERSIRAEKCSLICEGISILPFTIIFDSFLLRSLFLHPHSNEWLEITIFTVCGSQQLDGMGTWNYAIMTAAVAQIESKYFHKRCFFLISRERETSILSESLLPHLISTLIKLLTAKDYVHKYGHVNALAEIYIKFYFIYFVFAPLPTY